MRNFGTNYTGTPGDYIFLGWADVSLPHLKRKEKLGSKEDMRVHCQKLNNILHS